MKECKCGRIPPCYGGKKFRIHEELEKIKAGDETHDIVYELNKQMCNIGKTMNDPFEPLSEEAIQDITKALEITRKPKGIIMEKKTKKMTKAEAFEWLKCKKIDACGYLSEVQEKLFSLGITWITGDTFVARHGIYLFINEYGKLTHGGCDEVYWKRHHYKEIKADDILSIEIVEDEKDDERKGEILEEIAKLGEKISDLIEEYGGDVIVEIDLFDVILRNSGDILYRKR